jgi:hypothetical protein
MPGVDLFTKKEILGHWDIATTMHYSHLSPGFLHEAINGASLMGTGSVSSEDNQRGLEESTKLVD